MKSNKTSEQQIIVFAEQAIRRIFHENQWWFSIIDVVGSLSNSKNPRRYWSDLKSQLIETEEFSQLYEKIVQLKLLSDDGKNYLTDCANTETMLGEASTTEITRNINAQGFDENKDAARAGGDVAGNARKDLEKRSQRKIITGDNYLSRCQQIDSEDT